MFLGYFSKPKISTQQSAEVEANVESLLEMVVDLNERVRSLECVLKDEGIVGVEVEVEEPLGDDLLNKAVALVKNEEKVSVSFLQKNLKISYGLAFRVIDKLEEMKLIGAYRGTGERVVNR